jgi:multiple sugar transport system ATP-binding protein
MRLEISELHHHLRTTMIYVTHDQVEAMTMADRIVVLNGGRIEQVGSPLELYRNPANLFVAGFIGSPRMNFIHGSAAKEQDAATIGIRPEHITLSPDSGAWKGTVGIAEHLGSDTFIHIRTDSIGQLTARTNGDVALKHGDTIYLTPEADKIHRFGEQGQAL